MSKYLVLWKYIANQNRDKLILSFDEIKQILGFEIDHSFLSYKKELLDFGFKIDKISLKLKTVKILRNK